MPIDIKGKAVYQGVSGWDDYASQEKLSRYAKNDPAFNVTISKLSNKYEANPMQRYSPINNLGLAQDEYMRLYEAGAGAEPQMPDLDASGQFSGTSSRPDIPDAPNIDPYTAPKFALPTRDEGRENVLAATYAAPGLRTMRRQVQSAMGKNYANPNVKRLSLREALAGYGEGIENVLVGARNTAANQYGREYGYEVDAAKTQYGADVQEGTTNYGTRVDTAMRDWQNKWQGEMAGWEQEQKVASENRARSYDREMTKYKLEYDKYLKSMY
jgi:hypothetical protein